MAYGLRPTIKDGEVVLKSQRTTFHARPRLQGDFDVFKTTVEYRAKPRDRLQDEDSKETAELPEDLFPDFSYVKRKRKTKK